MKKEEKIFKAETKKLLNLMIHSIYTNKEIFLRKFTRLNPRNMLK